MNTTIQNLADKLARWAMAASAQNTDIENAVRDEVYKLIFRTNVLDDVWDETILLRLMQFLNANPPDDATFGDKVRLARERASRAHAINNLFYQALNGSPDSLVEEVSRLGVHPESCVDTLRTEELSDLIRSRENTPSERIATFLALTAKAFPKSLPEWIPDATKCLEAIRDREVIGRVNSLLINPTTSQGIVVALHAVVQDGTGATTTATSATQDFEAAIGRARLNLVKSGFIPPTYDAVIMGELTDASYSGASIALGSAIALFSSRSEVCIDPYTAFTGDIKLEGAEWSVRSVHGIPDKLLAAQELGFRKVFIPADNEANIPTDLKDSMRIVAIRTITEAIVCLQRPASDVKAESLQVRKVRALEAACVERGWSLAAPSPVQGGNQFTVSPPKPPELKVTIYATGAHSPKSIERVEFMQCLVCLNELDDQQITVRSVQETFNIKQSDLREQIRSDLDELNPTETVTESYCDYVLRFDVPPEKLVIKQYSSGKLQIQGRAGGMYQRVLEAIVTLYNVHHPNAKLEVEEFLGSQPPERTPKISNSESAEPTISLPYIGTDESGKGDYFGPLVVAAVWVDESLVELLKALGIRDSKTLSDKRCKELAQAIRESCSGSYEEVEILPKRYNALYTDFKKEGKTLNHLLAWGHARALESLLARRGCKNAVADQFGDESYIRSKLMERGKAVELLQTPKAERYLAVAAASVLARDRFLTRLEQAGREHGIQLPKGASPAVVEAGRTVVAKHGQQTLEHLAKLHFKTTNRVLAGTSA